MKTNLKTFLEGKEKEFKNLFGKVYLLHFDKYLDDTKKINAFLSQTAKEAYDLGKKEYLAEQKAKERKEFNSAISKAEREILRKSK